MTPNQNRYQNLLYGLAILKIILPYFLQDASYEPHRDEFLYLAEGHHLAWGFMEVPPMLSLFAWLTHLFGDGMFWIKLWPSLFGAATFIVAGRLILSLGGRSFALFLLFLPFIFGGYLRMFFLFQPNGPEVFFWTMIAFSLVRFIQTGRNGWLYLFGASAGLGMMSKYSVAFFIAAVLLGLLLTRERKIFLNKHFWFGALVGLIIFLPNIVWQYNRHFPVVHHMQELQKTQLQYISPVDFLLGQLLMNLPCFFIWLVGLWYLAFVPSARRFRFIAFAYLAVLILLMAGHGKAYYAVGVYPLLFAFGAYRLENLTERRKSILRYAIVLVPVALGLLTIPVALPVFPPQKLARLYEKMHTKKTGALKWEDLNNHPLPQDFADMLGWREMAEKMSKAYQSLDRLEKTQTLLFCDNYGMAGAINFYRTQYQLPEAYSDNASFLYWLPGNLHVDNLLLLTDDKDEMNHDFIKNFKSAVVVDSITTPLAREHGDLIILLKGANEAFNQMFEQKIAKDKAAFK